MEYYLKSSLVKLEGNLEDQLKKTINFYNISLLGHC